MDLRRSKLTGEIVHYYSGDPAFDLELRRTDVPAPPDASPDWLPPLVFDLQRWIETGDEACLPKKNGVAAVKFICRRLRPEERALIEDAAEAKGQNQAQLLLVRMSLVRVEPKPPDTPPITRVNREGVSLLDDTWTEMIRDHDGGRLFTEITVRLVKEMTASSRS